MYTWVCNSSIIHNPDRHKCNVIIVNNNTVNSVHSNMNNFYKPYIKQLAIKYFNIMVDNNYFILNSNTGKINSKFEILPSDSESIKYDTIYNTQTNEVINVDASNKDKLYISSSGVNGFSNDFRIVNRPPPFYRCHSKLYEAGL